MGGALRVGERCWGIIVAQMHSGAVDLLLPSSSRKKTDGGVNVGVIRTPTPEKGLSESV